MMSVNLSVIILPTPFWGIGYLQMMGLITGIRSV